LVSQLFLWGNAMKLCHAIRCGLCGPVFVLALVGCGAAPSDVSPTGGSSLSGPASPTDAESPAGEGATTPPSEGAGPEQPQQGEEKGPAIPVASLPIGGSVTLPGRDPVCASVSLRVTPPSAVSAEVTGVRIEPALFEVADSGCGSDDGPLCRDASFTFTSSRTSCVVPVRATGPAGSEASLILDGTARCPAGQEASCQRFLAAGQNDSVQLFGPEEAADTSSDGEQSGESGSSSSGG
jgi:hypothetical protein